MTPSSHKHTIPPQTKEKKIKENAAHLGLFNPSLRQSMHPCIRASVFLPRPNGKAKEPREKKKKSTQTQDARRQNVLLRLESTHLPQRPRQALVVAQQVKHLAQRQVGRVLQLHEALDGRADGADGPGGLAGGQDRGEVGEGLWEGEKKGKKKITLAFFGFFFAWFLDIATV